MRHEACIIVPMWKYEVVMNGAESEILDAIISSNFWKLASHPKPHALSLISKYLTSLSIKLLNLIPELTS
jgi:hypothetical protein